MRFSSAEEMNVSRETFEKLEIYANLLVRWNPAINLVSKASLNNLWHRHFVDSTQLFHLAPPNFSSWVDLGSGGGFPGMVVAICGGHASSKHAFTLIESDLRKAAFLRTVARETDVKVSVLSQRIEATKPQNADVLSARALAPLVGLLEYAHQHLTKGGMALFPKGVTWQDELAEAQKAWQFDLEQVASITDPEAVVLKIKGISRV